MWKIVNELKKNEWDSFVLEHGPRSGRFLQSWEWGEFQKAVGETVDRVAWMSNGGERHASSVHAIAQVIQKKIPGFGSYGYIPRGPICALSLPFARGGYASPPKPWRRRGWGLNELGLGDVFIRFEPTDPPSSPLCKGGYGAMVKSRDVQPAHTFITNLSQTEEQLFSNMHEKTRYNIRLAEKKGVYVEFSRLSEGGACLPVGKVRGGGEVTLDEVWSVFEMTSARDQFRLHQKSYYAKMIETLSDPPFIPPFARGEGTHAFLATASHDGEILAVNIMLDFGDTRTYLHGASSNVKRNFMAPYLLHWELMKDAKLHGIKFYDWWGVAPKDADDNHPWAGISRFKRGFGGEEVFYPGTFDLILSPIRFKLYQLLKKVRIRFRSSIG